MDRGLGGPLPRQLTNPTRAHLTPIQSFPDGPCGPTGLCGISSRFQLLSPCVRQITHALLTRPPLRVLPKNDSPFDLHVLGTPPAFILSQDQTLLLKLIIPGDKAEQPMSFTTIGWEALSPASHEQAAICFANQRIANVIRIAGAACGAAIRWYCFKVCPFQSSLT